MSRPTKIQIDLAAIRKNYQLAKSLAPNSRAIAVIKADAYGHGAVRVAQALEQADAFAVACIEEARALREANIRQPILLLEGFFEAAELAEISEQGFWSMVHCVDQIKALEQKRLAKQLNIWLKIDAGMHRLGMPQKDFANAYQRLRQCENVAELTLVSHFSSADELDNGATLTQLSKIDRCFKGLKHSISIANSAAVLAWPQTHRDWIRPGYMLYGNSPLQAPHANAERLRPAMALISKIIALRTLKAGESVGYGNSWRCEKQSLVGTVAVGYGDGYPRNAPSGTPILVNGQRARLIGRVSMDMLSVDLTDIPSAKVGDSVELWGSDISVNEVAEAAGTNGYELFARLTSRAQRIYLNV